MPQSPDRDWGLNDGAQRIEAIQATVSARCNGCNFQSDSVAVPATRHYTEFASGGFSVADAMVAKNSPDYRQFLEIATALHDNVHPDHAPRFSITAVFGR